MIIENKNKDIRLQIAFEICQILEKNNIKHFVDFGTLLGLYRNGKIIDHDYDFDIMAIFENEFDIFKNFLRLMGKYGLKMATRKHTSNIVFSYDNFVFEIYRSNIINKKVVPMALPKCAMPIFFIDELEKTFIDENIYFYTPRHKECYLKHRYGNDFMIPQKQAPDGSEWCNVDYNILPIKDKYTAYTYGVYDLTHYGHFRLFERIKKNFNKLVVGVHTDEDVSSYKNKPKYSHEIRKYMVSCCKYVDEIIDCPPLVTTDEYLQNIDCDFVVAGRENENYINKYYKVSQDKLHLIERTENISTTLLKNL